MIGSVTSDHFAWNWKGKAVGVGLDRLGAGATLLLLPAFSSISTRREMRPLQERLASDFATVAIDWPGFGDEPRPPIPGSPPPMLPFCRTSLRMWLSIPSPQIAAGHAASYALAAAAGSPNSTGLLCLIAPTWRGPLPTVTGGRRQVGEWISRATDIPVLGHLLYRLNVSPPVIRMMARGHVYADPDWLTRERLTQKMAVVSAPGALHASIRFVTGMLDLMASRTSFVETARGIKEPYSSSTEPLHRRGPKRRCWPSWTCPMFGLSNCRSASWPCTKNFLTLLPKL